MLDIKFIRENPKEVQKGAAAKGVKADVKAILKLDEERRALQTEVDELRRRQKGLGAGDRETARELKTQVKTKEDKLSATAAKLEALLVELPNVPRPDVKVGKDESDNEVLRQVGKTPKFAFQPRDYMELAQRHDLIDMERAGKVSGSRFGYLKNEAALLEFALVRYGLDEVLPRDFMPVIPPVLIGERAMRAMGYLEHGGEEETYHLKEDKLYLVATAEQSVGPMHMDETFDLKTLPRRYVAWSSCFRREAGSYGKDTKGILRVHQFNKLEMVIYTTPEESDGEHELLLQIEEKLMQGLGLPYQVVKMCSADLGVPAARKYDIETWIPSENKYRETHSCSTTTDFQSRRLNIRYKKEDGKLEFVHMLNGTVFSNRPIIAILENYQQADGTIAIPEVLRPYMGGRELIGKSVS
ncbi:MAG: serine--tRNA ligase [Candidatus Kerfeldbacteria bacterium]|nr:serine--tRNA ligase [Candidatus Kerfeldbacteria bacterium]